MRSKHSFPLGDKWGFNSVEFGDPRLNFLPQSIQTMVYVSLGVLAFMALYNSVAAFASARDRLSISRLVSAVRHP